MTTAEYPFHEAAGIFPLLSGHPFEELKADIEQHGQREPVVLWHGSIIDGRNRYRACKDLGRPVLTREWDGAGSVVAYVVSLNLRRRHLDSSQRAVAAAKAKAAFEAEAKERQRAQADRGAEGGRGNAKAENPPGAIEKPLAQICAKGSEGKSAALAAAALNVSPRLVESASKVLRAGAPALQQAVEQGAAKVSAAAVLADLPKPQQEQIVAAGPTAIVKAAREVRQAKAAPAVARRVEKSNPPPLPRQWSEVNGEVFSSPLRKVLDEIRLAGGVVKYAGAMSKPQRAKVAAELRKLRTEISQWITTLEEANER